MRLRKATVEIVGDKLYIRSGVTHTTVIAIRLEGTTNLPVSRAIEDANDGYDSPALLKAEGLPDSEKF